MQFSGLSNLFQKILGRALIDEKSLEEILNQFKKILLQNDVELELVNELIKKIEQKAKKVPKGLTLREHLIKTLYEELVEFLGRERGEIKGKKIMLIGLFGSGKTTTCAKLARFFQKKGLKVALVALDYHRAAAVDQLIELGNQIGVKVFWDEKKDVYGLAKRSLDFLKKYDVLIYDTAGRSALDEELAKELKKLAEIIKPDEVLLVIPADLGKVARKQASEFKKLVGITGVIITRMDGTAKGGAALAACKASDAKVKFLGTGEKIEDFEVYDPKRFVSRLLGLGDLETLLEKAKEAEIKPEKVEKVVEGEFTLEDFLEQFENLQKIGPLSQITKFLPFAKIDEKILEQQERKLKAFKAIIQSMNLEERRNVDILNASRIKRITKGSGRSEQEVRELINQYRMMKNLMKKFGKNLKKGNLKDLLKQFGLSF